MKKWLPYILCLCSGALLTTAFAPFYGWPVAMLAVMVLAWQQQLCSTKRAALLGYVFGFGFFSTSVSWVYISIHVYGNTNIFFSALLTLAFVAILACFVGIQGLLLGFLFPRASTVKLLVGFPSTWVISEWLRSWVLTGFPWVLLGYSQTNSPLKGLAPLIGVYGVSFIVCLLGCLLLMLLKQRFRYGFTIFSILLILGASYLFSWQHWTYPIGKPLSVSLLQGNVPQSLKWSEEEVEENKTLYRSMTLPHLQDNLIVWPESAITAPPWYVEDYLRTLSQETKQHNSTLIAGLPINDPDTPSIYYNGLIALGAGQGTYLKRHLVPFGEYVPLESWLRKLNGFFDLPMSDVTAGPRRQPLITAGSVQIAAFICYEIAYAKLVYPGSLASNLLLTISDDTWFGRSVAPYQHLQIGQWRALETGRPLLFASNSGTTAIVNAQGKITQILPLFVKASLDGSLQPMTGVTPIMEYGQAPILWCIIGLLGVSAFLLRRKQRSVKQPIE